VNEGTQEYVCLKSFEFMEKGQSLKCLSENGASFLAPISMRINTFLETGTLYQILSKSRRKRKQGRKLNFSKLTTLPKFSRYSFATFFLHIACITT